MEWALRDGSKMFGMSLGKGRPACSCCVHTSLEPGCFAARWGTFCLAARWGTFCLAPPLLPDGAPFVLLLLRACAAPCAHLASALCSPGFCPMPTWLLPCAHLASALCSPGFCPAMLVRSAADNAEYSKLVTSFISAAYTLRYTGGMVPDVHHLIAKVRECTHVPCGCRRAHACPTRQVALSMCPSTAG